MALRTRLAACLVALPWLSSAAGADVLIMVDKATQRMAVAVDGELLHSWPVSTGRSGYATPVGQYAALRLARTHYSREWDNAPMPYSIFFTERGHAIHASNATGQLGSPASHGCVRLAPAKAALLFELVREKGMEETRVVVQGEDPYGSSPMVWRGGGRDYSHLTALGPFSDIMAGGSGRGLRPR